MPNINFSQIKRYLAPLVRFRTAIAADRPRMNHHRQCADYLKMMTELMGLKAALLNIPQILGKEETREWAEFSQKHGIAAEAQVPSVWATTGAAAAEAERTLIFFGHHDVVSAYQEAWHTKPFELTEAGTNVYGRGVMDMKGGLAAQLAAIEQARQLTLPARTRLAFLSTPLEEKAGIFGGKAALNWLIRIGEINPAQENFVIVGEATSLNVLTIRRASYCYELELEIPQPAVEDTQEVVFRGNKSHAGDFDVFAFRRAEQSHALYEMARAYATGKLDGQPIWFEAGQPGSNGLITPNLFNVNPAIGKLYLARDGRSNPPLERVLEFLFEISARSAWQEDTPTVRGVSLNTRFRLGENNRYNISNYLRILSSEAAQVKELFNQAARQNGLAEGEFIPGMPKFDQRGSQLSIIAGEVVRQETGLIPDIEYMGNGCSDGQFAGELGLRVIEIGPVGQNEHSANESATIQSLVQTANIYFELIRRLLLA